MNRTPGGFRSRRAADERALDLPEWAETLQDLARAVRPFAPFVMSVLVFAGGFALMFSGSLPETDSRTRILRDVLPLPFAEASHLSASLSGLALLVIARGLYRRMALARIAATGLLVAGAVFSLVKGLNWENALLLLAIAAVLTVTRGEFFRKGDWREFRPGRTWLAIVALTVTAVTAIGLFVYSSTGFGNEFWWRFAWSGDAPRFMRASLALAVVVAALALDHLMNGPQPHGRARRAVPDAVRRLVAECPISARHLALLGDKEFMVSPEGNAFLMYAVSRKSWICLGGPVGDEAESQRLIWAFLEAADRAAGRPVFAAVPRERIGMLLDLGHAIVKMGEAARVDLKAFSLEGPQRKDLRYARSRAARDGLEFSILPASRVPGAIDRLRMVSDAWLETRKGREKGFALGFFDPDYLAQFDLAVMRREGRIVAFANLFRGAKEEMSVDLMRHLPGQSPVLMDALMTEILLYARAEGYAWFSLGAAPLSGLADHRLAPLWSRIGALVYRQADDFYSFEGLRAFKDKFDPVWSPHYLTCPGSLSIPRVMIDLAALVTRRREEETV
ncbi:MAG: phosphatidylglycerol lysyltransferase domain-containing protein [Pseudomonadota bacterium]